MSKQLLVFTDLDGTLLSHDHYAWQPAAESLTRLQALSIPVILNSSKTAIEITKLREELNNSAPYIVENGGAVVSPPSSIDARTGKPVTEEIKLFGRPYAEILHVLDTLRSKTGYRFSGFSDMGVDGIVKATGLSRTAAVDSARRHCSEPLLWLDSDAALETFTKDLAAASLCLVRGGRFLHVMGAGNKGKAMIWLLNRYQQAHPTSSFTTIALGDGENDLPMLEAADIAVIIPPRKGSPLLVENRGRLLHASEPGPVGWQEAMTEILKTYT